ncbi:NAD+ kinase [Catalinimonas alkaloidigena]|uniref:NAD kinase n=1 Tax=Catalinimonas alkaloidigena TaxID=1075417 RepID=A0A1G9DUP2_9BACT|nr:NAD kinase [Catalinimonas alkaloidigena]SDK67594.1 NAD+ kinase [Catalinimonas alkaloidigena]
MKIAIHGRDFKSVYIPSVQLIFNKLQKYGTELLLNQGYASILQKNGIETGPHHLFNTRHELDADLVISLGGDGTLLETVTYVAEKETPILGINIGRLGFLATTSNDQIDSALAQVMEGYYEHDCRTLVRLESDCNLFQGLNFGLNEFTILKRDTSSMIVVHTYIDGEYLNSYWADGLIVATPTGSTGYSLSCGGPVVLPDSKNFIISPVSPHNLNVRPMVVSDTSVISFEIEGRSNNFLVSLDSRSETVDAGVQLAVRKEDFQVKLVKLNGYNFLNTLRSKLNWGYDIRN